MGRDGKIARKQDYSSVRRAAMSVFKNTTVQANGLTFHCLETGRGAAHAVSAWISRSRPIVSLPVAGACQSRLPGRCPVLARLCANRRSAQRSVSGSRTRAGYSCAHRPAGRRFMRFDRTRLGRGSSPCGRSHSLGKDYQAGHYCGSARAWPP